MRVIAGKLRSRPLRSLRGLDIRPTSDRLRETLFNILTAGNPGGLAGSVWLDLFAGTGAVGIEALSRGAAKVYFVEVNKDVAELISTNLQSLGIATGFEILRQDFGRALETLERQSIRPDFVFLDPPYRKMGDYEQVLGFLSQSRLLASRSIVIAEHDNHFDPGEAFGALRRHRKLQQGDAVLCFYSRD